MSDKSIARVPHVHAEVIKAWAGGAQIEYRTHSSEDWERVSNPHFDVEFQYRVKPEKVYPVTQMNEGAICSAYFGGGPVNGKNKEMAAFYRIANAALRHAIDANQVVPMAEVQEVARNLNKQRYERAERALLTAGFADLGGQDWEPPLGKAPHFIEVGDPKRDIAIAEAVRDACRKPFEIKSIGPAHWITPTTAYGRVSGVDLAAIIAGVRP